MHEKSKVRINFIEKHFTTIAKLLFLLNAAINIMLVINLNAFKLPLNNQNIVSICSSNLCSFYTISLKIATRLVYSIIFII